MQRRQLIKLTTLGSVMLPLPAQSWAAGSTLRKYHHAPAGNGTGSWLVVDGAVDRFTGEGVYLYPAWGSPRPYLVRPAGSTGVMAFHDPVNGRLLWTQTATLEHVFAGRVHASYAGLEPHHLSTLQVLAVPGLPLAS